MKPFSVKERVLLSLAPVCAPLSFLVGQHHELGSADTLDTVRGLIMGFGIGLALAVLIKRKISGGC